jgi:hypothetical protein
MKIVGSCDLYSGGLVFKFGFGDYQGHTLTMIAWHGVLHETQTGHIALASAASRWSATKKWRMPPMTKSATGDDRLSPGYQSGGKPGFLHPRF